MDLDREGVQGEAELPWREMTTALRKVAFSSCKVALAAKNEANCYWWDSC